MDSQSKTLGIFVKSLVKLEETKPPREKMPFHGRDILLLFLVNPHSTIQLLEGRLKSFPQEYQNNRVLSAVNRVLRDYNRLHWGTLAELNLVESEFWLGYGLAEQEKMWYNTDISRSQKWVDSP